MKNWNIPAVQKEQKLLEQAYVLILSPEYSLLHPSVMELAHWCELLRTAAAADPVDPRVTTLYGPL
jgi:hypothetical protein